MNSEPLCTSIPLYPLPRISLTLPNFFLYPQDDAIFLDVKLRRGHDSGEESEENGSTPGAEDLPRVFVETFSSERYQNPLP